MQRFFSVNQTLNPKPFLQLNFFSTTSSPTSPQRLIPNFLHQCQTLTQTKLLHQQILTQNLTQQHTTRLIAAYISVDSPSDAVYLLGRIPPSDYSVFWWNSLIRRSLHRRELHETLSLFGQMRSLSWKPDGYTFPFVITACGEIPLFRCGESVHGVVLLSGFEGNVFVCNAIVSMYGRCGALGNARKMFEQMLERSVFDVVSWNSIVTAYVQSGDAETALRLFDKMVNGYEMRPEAIGLVNVLPACASVKDGMKGKEVHASAIRSRLIDDVYVGNAVVDMYAKCGMIDEASKVFKTMKVKDVVSWNAIVTGYSQIGRFEEALGLFEQMREQNIELNVVTYSAVISGYAQRGLGYEAISVFKQMQVCGSEPNEVTLISLLSGCAAVGALLYGQETHGYVIKRILNLEGDGSGNDLMVVNALIDMYAKCKRVDVARVIFDSVTPRDRNVATWTVMIGGYAQHGEANDALELLSQMMQQVNSVKPNAFTISCALMACVRLAALRFGRQIHGYVLRNHYDSVMLHVANCLIDMYAKSGDVEDARVVFDNMRERNAVSWTSLMTGYGMHGRGEEALQLFNAMREVGFVPDGVTFLVVLYACSHSGMVNKGMDYFNRMRTDFGVIPGQEHYACIVDLLGRAGRLDEAMKIIEDMPVDPTPIVWVALLSGCRTHANVELGEYAAERLSKLDSENDGSYTLLSNLYANARRWKDVARIRSLMKHTGIKKRPGCSWVQGKKGTATFFVGDRSHPQSQQIYQKLADLIQRIKDMGYVPETSFALHDVADEEKDDLLFEHSEKLALVYGILTTSPGAPIRITKNLRVCGDCHTAFVYISKIIEHEIILRDPSRFHHFKKGSCSCNGYW